MKRGFDCHAHVYARLDEAKGSNYRPSRPAPLDEWQGYLDDCRLRGGALVQPSFLGHDNRELLQTLRKLGEGFRGVVQLPKHASLAEMKELDAAGIVGVRWNLIERRRELPDLDDPQWIDFLDRLKALNWHLELHLEGNRLPELFPALHAHGVTLVIDHLGLPVEADPFSDSGFRILLEAGRTGRTWVKLSAPYRSLVHDLKPHVRALLDELGRERLVWGSDWPWTRHEGKHSYRDTFDWLAGWVSDDDDRRYILEKSPQTLFRLG